MHSIIFLLYMQPNKKVKNRRVYTEVSSFADAYTMNRGRSFIKRDEAAYPSKNHRARNHTEVIIDREPSKRPSYHEHDSQDELRTIQENLKNLDHQVNTITNRRDTSPHRTSSSFGPLNRIISSDRGQLPTSDSQSIDEKSSLGDSLPRSAHQNQQERLGHTSQRRKGKHLTEETTFIHEVGVRLYLSV